MHPLKKDRVASHTIVTKLAQESLKREGFTGLISREDDLARSTNTQETFNGETTSHKRM
jgi:hypothetical protein